jgi:hypothetical protein
MARRPSKNEIEARQTEAYADLAAPWRMSNIGYALHPAEMEEFIRLRTDLHGLYIREAQRTHRIGMGLAAALLAFACAIPVFAPPGRETLSYWVGLALFVFAAGSMGYSSIKLASSKRQISLTKGRPHA